MPVAWKCRGCGYEAAKKWWNAPCPNCGRYWNIKQIRSDMEGAEEVAVVEEGEVVSFQDAVHVAKRNQPTPLETGVEGADRVLGGGFFPGSLVTLCGDPNAGKTTFLLVLLRALALRRETVLYVAGEESLEQLGFRAQALGRFPARMQALYEQELDTIFEKIDEVKPSLVVVDSINMVNCFSERTGDEFEAGSAASIKTATRQFMKFAKANRVVFVLVAQLGRDSAIAGPKALEYLVDVNLWLRVRGERRVLEATKNRFGRALSTGGQRAVFRMDVREREDGQTEVAGMAEVSDEDPVAEQA